MRGIESYALLVICCEGKSKNLTEEIYHKQLNEYIKSNNPKFIKFNEIQIVKITVDEIFNIKKLSNKLDRIGKEEKFSFIAIWKDNDDNSIIQKQNDKICSMKNNIFKTLKKYLKKEKKLKENFGIWILPKGWNFETYYRNHFLNFINISDKKLKERFKEPRHFHKKIFYEENFRIINDNLKKVNSPIDLFYFADETFEIK